jgi:hypothetical protein
MLGHTEVIFFDDRPPLTVYVAAPQERDAPTPPTPLPPERRRIVEIRAMRTPDGS